MNKPHDTDPNFWKLGKLAARWNVNYGFVRRMVRDGKIKALRIGSRSIRIPTSEIARIEGELTTTQNQSEP